MKNNKEGSVWQYVRIIVLTVLTVGIYGAYWAMSDMFKEDDINTDEMQKDADFMKRSAASAFLSRFYSGR